jgi:hypothetical protein
MHLEAVGKGSPYLVVLRRTDFPHSFEAKFTARPYKERIMLAGVSLAHPCSNLGLAQNLKKYRSAQNSLNSEHIDNTPYLDSLEDAYAFVADRMSSLEQYVPSRDTFHVVGPGVDV